MQKVRIPKNIETQKKILMDDFSEVNQELEEAAQENRNDQIDGDFACLISEIEAIRNEEYELVLQQMANEAEDDR